MSMCCPNLRRRQQSAPLRGRRVRMCVRVCVRCPRLRRRQQSAPPHGRRMCVCVCVCVFVFVFVFVSIFFDVNFDRKAELF